MPHLNACWRKTGVICRNWLMPLATALWLGACATPPPPEEKPAEAAKPVIPAEALQRFAAAGELLRGGKLDVADAELKALTDEYPTLAGAWFNRAWIAYQQKRWADAEAAMTQLHTLRQAPQDWHLSGRIYRAQGLFENALAAYEQGLALDATSPDLLLDAGILQELFRNQPQQALSYYRRYVQAGGPRQDEVSGWIALIEATAGGQ